MEYEAPLEREELEKLALEKVCACDYYDLCDNMESTSDEELQQIIDNADKGCDTCKA